MDAEQISLKEINASRAMVHKRYTDFGEDMHYFGNGRNELSDGTELLTIFKKEGDLVVNDSVPLSPIKEAIYLVNDDEYAIISDCEDVNEGVNNLGDEMINEFILFSVTNENDTSNGLDGLKNEDRKSNHEPNRIKVEKVTVPNTFENKVGHVNKRLSSVEYSVKTESLIVNGVAEKADPSSREYIGLESDEEFPYEVTSTPNKDYEMKILAGPSEVKKAEACDSDHETVESKDRVQINRLKLKKLSSRFRKSIDDLSVQNKPVERLKSNSMEELRNLNSDILHESESETDGIKLRVLAGGSLSTSEFDLKSSLWSAQIPSQTITTFKRPVSEVIQVKNFDLEMADMECTKTSVLRSNVNTCEPSWDNMNNTCPSEEIEDLVSPFSADESFFEIEIRPSNYGYDASPDYPSKCEFEMKTILRGDSSDEHLGLLSSTDFILARTQIEMLVDCAFNSRFLSIYRQDFHRVKKFINVLYVELSKPEVSVGETRDIEASRNVEIVEEMNTLHLFMFVNEKIIYEEEQDGCKGSSSAVAEEWLIIE